MSQPLVYIDTSEVHDGALDELKKAIEELVAFIEANEPQILAYHVYLNESGSQMTVMHVHADPASFDHHMDVAGPVFRKFATSSPSQRSASTASPATGRCGRCMRRHGSWGAKTSPCTDRTSDSPGLAGISRQFSARQRLATWRPCSGWLRRAVVPPGSGLPRRSAARAP